MSISKFTIVWKFLAGGREGVLDYALDVANNFAAKIPDAKQEELKGYLETATKVLDTLSGLFWPCPKKWMLAYGHTVAAFAALVSALQDLKLTADEIATITAAFQTLLEGRVMYLLRPVRGVISPRSSFFLALAAGLAIATAFSGCVYRGAKITKETDLAIGMTAPGTEGVLPSNALNYLSGFRLGAANTADPVDGVRDGPDDGDVHVPGLRRNGRRGL